MDRANLKVPHTEIKSAFVAYIPVIHHGYVEWFAQHPAVKDLFLLSPDLVRQYGPTHKHLHGLSVLTIQQFLLTLNIFNTVSILDEPNDITPLQSYQELYLPDEEITRNFQLDFLPEQTIHLTSIFLRWDKVNSTRMYLPHPAQTVIASAVSNQLIEVAQELGSKSSDWWRQVGAIAVKNGRIVGQAYNTHMPSEQTPYIEGDGRAEFHKGKHMELTTAIHAEARLIAEAAALGTALAGAELYVTDFPCPSCAKLIAAAKISTVYYQHGYAVFDGERILNTAGVTIIKIDG